MRRLRAWLVRASSLFRKGRLEQELAEELESHLQLDMADRLRAGLSGEEARRQALLRLGGLEPVKEAYRDRRGIPFLESLRRDLSYAARVMRAHPGFAAAVIITLGLGIGATTAIFTVVNGVLLRPLPYPEPDRLVYVSQILAGTPNPFTYVGDYAALRDHNRTLSQIAGYMYFEANSTRGDYSERVHGGLATRSLFDILGVQAALGRNFLPEEDAPGGPPVAILSHGFWRNGFGSDPAVIGKSVVLDGRPYNIVGVLPPGFRVPGGDANSFDLWLPFQIGHGKRAALDTIMMNAVGRRKPGVTLQRAAADLDALRQVKLRNGMQRRIVVSAWQTEITRYVRSSLVIFSWAVGFVLLIACVNVANLLLSRAATREKEVAVRRAIGAGRGRILRQLLTESALQGLLGGLLGLALAYWGRGLLIALLAPSLPSLDPILIDRHVLLFNVAIALLTGIAFGLAPALQISKLELTRSLKESGRGASEGLSQQRLRSLLILFEVAAAMVLLSGAGLLVRSFLRLHGLDAGYQPGHILTMNVELTESKYKTPAAQSAFFQQALARIGGLPGILSVGATTYPPFSQYTLTLNEITLEGQPTAPAEIVVATVNPDYFRTLGIPLVGGRYLSAADREGSPSVLLVNESFARRYYPGGNCLGRRLRNWDKDSDWMTIAGVVRDARTYLEKDPSPEVYISYLQAGASHMTLVVRTAGDPLSISAAVRSQIAGVDRTQPVHNMTTLEQAMDEQLGPRRVKMLLAVLFAALALTLGAVGIYGVLAYSVKRRTHEIGIRLALGARPGQILGMVMRSGLGLVGAGIAIGTAASLWLMKLITGELWGVSATDPWTLASVAAVLAASGIAACLLPSRRAAKVDPMLSLRYE